MNNPVELMSIGVTQSLPYFFFLLLHILTSQHRSTYGIITALGWGHYFCPEGRLT